MNGENDQPKRLLSFHLLHSAVQDKYLIPVFVAVANRIHVVRTLDPEDDHQVSLARIFQAAGLTIIEGLLKFELVKNVDYHTELGFTGPNIAEIWVNVGRARSIVASLWQFPPAGLIQLLAPSLDRCWTLYDITRSSLLHNWRIKTIRAEAYSTSILLKSFFEPDEVESPLSKPQWIRSGIPERNSDASLQSEWESALLIWAVSVAERSGGKGAVPDHWTPVLRNLEKHAGILASRISRTERSAASSTRMEADVVATCERLLRQAVTSKTMSMKQKSEFPVKHIDSRQTRSVSTQTEEAQIEVVDPIEKTSHLDSIKVLTRFKAPSTALAVVLAIYILQWVFDARQKCFNLYHFYFS